LCAPARAARVFGRPEPTVTTTMFTRPARQGCPKRGRAEGSRENRYDLRPVNANFVMRAHENGGRERASYITLLPYGRRANRAARANLTARRENGAISWPAERRLVPGMAKTRRYVDGGEGG